MRRLFFGVGMMVAMIVVGQGKLSFEKEIHDFGLVREGDEYVEYTFLFSNTGDRPVRITTVKTSCGCTTPFWSKEEILPGDTGRITARYNTINRPGPFTKDLQVTSNAENNSISLIIKGQVKPEVRSIEREFPANFGAIRLRYRNLNMGTITTERIVSKSFEVYNEADTAFTFFKSEAPEHLLVRMVPDQLGPKEMGEIRVTYDPERKNDLGYLTDQVRLFTSDIKGPEKLLNVVATVEEYFPVLTEEELATKPRLTFDKKLHDFKKVLSGDTAQVDFLLTNSGQDTLKIRTTRTNCTCTTSNLEKDTLAPGEEAKLTVAFNTAGRKGQQFKNVTIFSNDPMAPTQMVSVKAIVQE